MLMKVKFPFYARLALVLFSICLIIVILEVGSTLFVPIIFGTLIALLLYPLARFFEKILPRSIASMLSLVIFICLVFILAYFLSSQIASFTSDIPMLEKRVNLVTKYVQHMLSHKYGINRPQQAAYFNNAINNSLGAMTGYLQNTFIFVTELSIWIVFVIIYTYFILFYRATLVRFVVSLFSEEYQVNVNAVLTEGRLVINRYILGLLLEMTAVAVLNCSILSVIGMKYVILLGVLVAVLNIIPYIGIFTGIAISMLVAFTYSGGSMALTVGIALVGVHLVDSNILMPRIVGSQVNINALMTVVAVFAGSLIWGVAGMFLFVPLTAIFKIIAEHVPDLKPWAILLGAPEKKKKGKFSA